MAIVPDLARPSPVDKPWTTFNRRVAAEPNATIAPEYAGEIVIDITNNVLWKAMSPANDTWVALTSF